MAKIGGNLPLTARFGVFFRNFPSVTCMDMKRVKHVSGKILSRRSQGRFLRRFIKGLFSSVMKQQSCHCKGDAKELRKKFKEVEERIEVFAREVARQAKGRRG
jgi:hypothetical protein